MTLPFQKDTGNRKFQCFVCGVVFDSIVEMKEHVIEEHEEGREYIKCPLKRCGYPVRDVRSHFKKYHPKEKIPKNCQLKAIVWKDQRNPKRKHKKPTFKEGYFVSFKNNGKPMHYRSGLECDVYKCLEQMDEVVKYEVESCKIKYFLEGKVRTYWPDIQLCFNDGHVELWEVKPSRQTNLPINKAKWDAAKEYCGIRNWKFDVITEQVVEKMKKKLI